ncbi:MAG: argininosuccinate lyase [Anaerolineales bacterium]|uniref:argininosuccinate lyase n=1 Tax=Candidatus Villigracilis vicinus TaxID=3140679 RepID=UPI003136248B|nr:argininosuccinate lyase [Anaerolineales bacterium]
MTLWGGRFTQSLDSLAWALNSSLPVDQRMAIQDVEGSIAWAAAIHNAGILTDEEHASISLGLDTVRKEFASGEFIFQPSDEDIHTAVERRLSELIGAAAGKLHTGRSRNDQVATDFRLWMLQAIPELHSSFLNLQSALVEQAELAGETIMPGYTHLQRAQPILLGHWWLSHYWALKRDVERLNDLTKRVSVLPLGSGALAGAPFALDRDALAKNLGFSEVSQNSLDAVSDRDFAAEYLFVCSMASVHLSKLAEQIVLYTTAEFGFFELSDAFSTGSSLMPQKKNPDVFELTRGKAGTMIGLLTGLMSTLKGLPSTYDKDLQEDKAPVFAATDTLLSILPVMAAALRTITVKPERMRSAIDSTMMATDLADYLVEKGVPFREAHSLAGKVVRAAGEGNVRMEELPLEAYQAISPVFEADVVKVFDPLESINKRNTVGGTSLQSVKNQISKIKGE